MIRLEPHYEALPDVAGFAERYRKAFDLEVFEPDASLPDGYDPYGADCVSQSLITQGVWEGQESTLAADILAATSGLVLDFGAHVGWYSVMASIFGEHRIIAYEHDQLMINALNRNANVDLRTCTIDETFQIEDLSSDIALLKCDLEGADGYVVQACDKLFREHRIRYALIEVSPIFTADGRSQCNYVNMVATLLDHGYTAYRIPQKGWEYNDVYREQPLATLKTHCRLGVDWADVIANCRQDNFVFIRPEEVCLGNS